MIFNRHQRWILPALASVALYGCGGAGGGNNDGNGGGVSSGDEPDAVVQDIPIAYVRRSIPLDDGGDMIANDVLDPSQFVPGAALFLRERADADANETNLTEGVFPEGELYDVKDLSVSNDGERMVFAMRAPEIEDADDDEQPTWNIWEYSRVDGMLRRIIPDDITAEAGQDVNPHYLPDGRIVFSTTRQVRSRAVLLDDGKPQYAAQTEANQEDGFVLHVMDEFGLNIEQLTYNQSHDLQPVVMPDGQIVFNRWNNKDRANIFSLFSIRPDGQDNQELYGYESQNTGTDGADAIFFAPQAMADGRILSLHRPREAENWGGDLIAIDAENFSDRNQDIALPINVDDPGGEVMMGGQESLAFGEIPVDDDPNTISLNGYFAAAADLFDQTPRLLVSWTDCRLEDPDDGAIIPCLEDNLAIEGIQEAIPLYGLWIYNLDELTLQPLFPATPGEMYTDIVSFGARAEDLFLADRQAGVDLQQTLVDENLAELHIRNVYEVAGEDTSVGIATLADPVLTSADERPARFLKIEKAVSIPDDDVFDFERSAFGFTNVMREIIGYVPVEPDGSVKTVIPTDVALTVSITNALGQRVSRTSPNWFTARAGEEIESADLSVSLRRLDATQPSSNPGAPANGFNFPNTEPLLIAFLGETMAETFARINGTREPSVDLVFNDDWTNPAIRPKFDSFEYRYADLSTEAPATEGCQLDWDGSCRVEIHYPDHIQVLWDLDRTVSDDMGNVISDNTCTVCHNTRDAMGELQVPAGQLELTQMPLDGNQQFRSFRELGANDNEDAIVDGALVERTEEQIVTDGNGNVVFQMDDDGNLILDDDGNPIPETILITFPVARSLAPNNAQGSRFFDLFEAGQSHEGFLSQAELKLIGEWLDLGGQYYNDPFDAPED
ncbi:hypothetical protein [Sessilibacter corallicola]|uniref:Hydrazine synthase alpha subunit middle domain-containing protein n=1 Tax=Sessilibacter corallicola TaxID=2904075 RepID=A0ABQ0A711_9GAMM